MRWLVLCRGRFQFAVILCVVSSRWLNWKWLPAPLLPSPHQLCVWSALCFSSFVTLSRTTWNHTLCLLGELPPLQHLCLLSLTHKHTPLHFFFSGNRQVGSLHFLLSQTHTLWLFLTFFPNSTLVCSSCPPPALSVFSAPLSCSNAWRFNATNVRTDWRYGSVSVCVRVWGLFHIESWAGEVKQHLSFMSETEHFPNSHREWQTEKIRARGRKWGKGWIWGWNDWEPQEGLRQMIVAERKCEKKVETCGAEKEDDWLEIEK